MSVIVAIKDNGAIYMGADSQTTSSNRKFTYLNETCHKIVKLDNGILVGFCGKVAARQAILSYGDIFTLDGNGELTKEHIVTQIVPKLVDKIEQIGDEERGSLDVSILLAYKDVMFRIPSSMCVFKQNEIARIGAGMDFVDYTLWERTDLPVRDRIIKALVSSAKRTESVSGPYVLIDTLTSQYEIVDMGDENH